jgi:hypothetical protein
MMLTSSETERLRKLLALTGSSNDAEALAAVRKANELVKGEWANVIAPPMVPDATVQLEAHQKAAQQLLERGKSVITRFEANFLRGIMAFKSLSEAQQKTLRGIRLKVAASKRS